MRQTSVLIRHEAVTLYEGSPLLGNVEKAGDRENDETHYCCYSLSRVCTDVPSVESDNPAVVFANHTSGYLLLLVKLYQSVLG